MGQLLAYESQSYAIVVLGGAALNLLGIVERPTSDVDILAFARPEQGRPHQLREPPEPMPEPLRRAIREVARDMRLEEDWLNVGPALQWRAGLPPGLAGRVHWRQYNALHVGLVDRYDLIFFKLFAAADSPGPRSVHYRDLVALGPTGGELDAAAEWVQTQDAAPEFTQILQKVVSHVRHDLGFDDASHARRDR
ncbi:MAG: hypothetical protein ABIP09_08065 [Gemmatimonadaceae bacterium]